VSVSGSPVSHFSRQRRNRDLTRLGREQRYFQSKMPTTFTESGSPVAALIFNKSTPV